MSYSLSYSIALGSSQTGLTLEAQLVDTSGANFGSAITTGFTEIGGGNYLWYYNNFPDGFNGGVRFQIVGGGALKAFSYVQGPLTDNRWSPPTAIATVLSTELDNMAAGARVLSATIDNSVNLDFRDDLELTAVFASAATAPNASVVVFILPSLDGTNYADGGPSVQPSANLQVASFPIASTVGTQRVVHRAVRLPPGKFKYLLWNQAGVPLSTGNFLKRISYHQKIM